MGTRGFCSSAYGLVKNIDGSDDIRKVYDSKEPTAKDVVTDTVLDIGFFALGKIKKLANGVKIGISRFSKVLSGKDIASNFYSTSKEYVLEDFMELSDYSSITLLDGIDNDAMSMVDSFVSTVDGCRNSDYSEAGDKAGYAEYVLVPKMEELRTELTTEKQE